jgi:hypothetical protein
MRSLLALLLLVGCTGSDDAPKDTSDADADTDVDTDTNVDTDPAADRDGDGYAADVDCDDTRADVNPGVVADICNDRDDDCDGNVDENADLRWYPDSDGDGYGAIGATPTITCDPGAPDFATNDTDCDDTNGSVWPGADDVCDGVDNDCSGGIDDDTSMWTLLYPDADRDGYGADTSSGTRMCDLGSRAYVDNNDDCDDARAAIAPGSADVCDGRDNDCSGATDDDPTTWLTYYLDADSDGAGDPDEAVYGCDATSAGGTDNAWDCDDADPYEPVFVDIAGSSRGSGTLTSPFTSVQAGIDKASVCVAVGPGSYFEDLDFGGRNIRVEGLYGSAETTIYGTGSDSVVTFDNGESADAVLKGFTITGGAGQLSASTYSDTSYTYYYYYAYGGGIYISGSSPTLEDLVITNNSVYGYTSSSYSSGTRIYYYTYMGYGGGIFNTSGSPSLTDVEISRNSGYIGAAMYDSAGAITGTRVRVRENSGEYYTWYAYGGNADFENLEVNADYSSYGYSGLYAEYTTVALTNATIVSTDYGVYGYGSVLTMQNSVINGTTCGLCDGGSTTWSLRYNDVYGNSTNYSGLSDPTGTGGNVSVSPGFTSYTDDADADADDLSLSSRSSLVDAGDPDAAYNDADGSVNDMGAYGGPEGSW